MARIITCDDQEGWRISLKAILAQQDHEVAAECDSPDTLRVLVRKLSPVIVVTDLHLKPHGRADGFRLAAELRDEYEGTAVLVVSNFNGPWLYSEILNTGARGVSYL